MLSSKLLLQSARDNDDFNSSYLDASEQTSNLTSVSNNDISKINSSNGTVTKKNVSFDLSSSPKRAYIGSNRSKPFSNNYKQQTYQFESNLPFSTTSLLSNENSNETSIKEEEKIKRLIPPQQQQHSSHFSLSSGFFSPPRLTFSPSSHSDSDTTTHFQQEEQQQEPSNTFPAKNINNDEDKNNNHHHNHQIITNSQNTKQSLFSHHNHNNESTNSINSTNSIDDFKVNKRETFDEVDDENQFSNDINLTSTPTRILSPRNNDLNQPYYNSYNMSSRFISPSTSYDHKISDQNNKYIIQLKTDEFDEKDFTLTKRQAVGHLIIDAKHYEEDQLGGYIRRELHKIFPIPKHIDINNHQYSYNRNMKELTIELPHLQQQQDSYLNSSYLSSVPRTGVGDQRSSGEFLTSSYRTNNDLNLTTNSNTSGIGTNDTSAASKNIITSHYEPASSILTSSSSSSAKPFDFDLFHRSVFRPQIVSTSPSTDTNDKKKLVMNLDLSDYTAEDIKVSIKDRDLIVKAERKVETDTRKSRASFYQSTSLPPQTDIENLRSNYMDGKLVIEAPYLEHYNQQQQQQHRADNPPWNTVAESQRLTTIDNPHQHRTEKVTEILHLNRIK
ncbi:unnamed protein product [Didymodactylos carnosus]|uniref:SHSP domain-containing protein n=1 Tax=Didymodactylos carnosus TaxID=1234261 RepID=A0A813WKC6_9BILA|nr:unnamed protein product [Didymodactylos carnosus]CAF0856224.1 unnamed protein product [Didymodactylos carnosus]CAF3504219.1 unnamed protein product [Didymodactylos carnosus]CAF3643990.1 unnamed protein product [Didymodactylos carnosus]